MSRAHALAEGQRHARDVLEVRDVLRPPLREDGGEDLLLVAEVVVDQPVGDAGALGDVGDARAVHAAPSEHLGGGFDDALARARAAARHPRRRAGAHPVTLAATSCANSPSSTPTSARSARLSAP